MKTAIKSLLALSLVFGAFIASPIATPKASAATYGETYTNMHIGDSNMFIGGDKYQVLNGQGVLTVNQYGMVNAIGPGKATVVVYKNGVIYWVHYVTVTR